MQPKSCASVARCGTVTAKRDHRLSFKSAAAIAIAWLTAVSSLSVPTVTLAQPSGDYGNSGDICRSQKDQAGSQGTVAGAILGGIFGAAISGRHNRAGGAIVGGTAGAIIGNSAGRHSVQCRDYPHRYGYHRSSCRWVAERYDDADHEFEVCRDRDGVWRPSGRG